MEATPNPILVKVDKHCCDNTLMNVGTTSYMELKMDSLLPQSLLVVQYPCGTGYCGAEDDYCGGAARIQIDMRPIWQLPYAHGTIRCGTNCFHFKREDVGYA